MSDRVGKILLIGYGNPGRLDDGLGPALARALEQRKLAGVTVESDYQLTVEDAAAIAQHDVVVFADAAVDGPEPFYFERLVPEAAVSFSSHSVAPAAALALAEELFEARGPGYVLGIRGYEFNEFGQWLSERAQTNLVAAVDFIGAVLTTGAFEEAARQHQRPASGSDGGSCCGEATCKTENT